ncbi:MAG: hypothetical protein JWO78_1765 [Micavibrio sp.]|nr:hypothetical protein [Micavibrio sp.]
MENTAHSNATDEITAMSKIASALEALDSNSKKRVLTWACQAFGVQVSGHKPASTDPVTNDNATSRIISGDGVAEVFDKADPQTGAQKALVVAYWFQTHDGLDGFSSQAVNSELKNLGHGIANITAAFTDLLEDKLALQVQKSGKTQQARKVYKLTRKGILQVEAMINNGGIE